MRLALALLLAASAAQAETRCGWIVNPTPANWWLTDADAEWVLMLQGGPGVPGMEVMPDFSQGEWVEVNGSYGYGCACLEMRTDGVSEVYEILSARQLPLSTCENDPALPGQ
jgi:Protein of unknown function (DUF4087)